MARSVSPLGKTPSPLLAFCSFFRPTLPIPLFPVSYVGEGFPVCEACEEGLAANPGQGCKECEIPSWKGRRGRKGKEWRRKTRLPKTRHGRGAKLWRLEGGGSGSTTPAWASPQNALFSSQPVNHSPFKHHVVHPSPLLPALQPAQAPSRA